MRVVCRLMPPFRCFSVLGLLLLVASMGCDGLPGGPSPSELTGVWGGDHISLTISQTGSHLEFDCAHGELPGAMRVDASGAFAIAGAASPDPCAVAH